MEKLLSNRLHNQFLPESYILPLEKRPNIVPKYKTIPVIDLGRLDTDPQAIVQEIIKASKEFGIFQVINHGCQETIMKDMLDVAEEFFVMPIEDRMEMYSEDPEQTSRLFSSINYNNEETHIWRDFLIHPVHPVEEFKNLWPSKPTNYRQVTERYSKSVRSLGLKILELIGEGLGIGSGYFHGELTETQLLLINHYPPCPEPSLTVGLPKHVDINLITVLLQGNVSGLQVFKEGEWIAVEPIPNAFTINLGHQLQIITNWRLKGAEHQVVTNSKFDESGLPRANNGVHNPRTTISNFIAPSLDCIIQPAKELVDEFHPPKFKIFKYKEFRRLYHSLNGDTEPVLKALRQN